MHQAGQERRPLRAKAYIADEKRQDQEHHVGRRQAQGQASSGQQAGGGYAGYCQADRRAGRAHGDVQAALQLVVERGANRRDRLRHQNQPGDHCADNGVGLRHLIGDERVLDACSDLLGQHDDADQPDQQENSAGGDAFVSVGSHRGAMCLPVDEIVAVADSLREQKTGIKQHRKHADEAKLRRRERAGIGGSRVGRQNERHDAQRDQHRQIGAGPLADDCLLAMAPAAKRQAHADDAGGGDHHRREHGFARKRRVVGAVQHDGNDDRHFDCRHGDGQHQRAVRLAHPPGHRLGVVEHHENGGEHDRARQRADKYPGAQRPFVDRHPAGPDRDSHRQRGQRHAVGNRRSCETTHCHLLAFPQIPWKGDLQPLLRTATIQRNRI